MTPAAGAAASLRTTKGRGGGYREARSDQICGQSAAEILTSDRYLLMGRVEGRVVRAASTRPTHATYRPIRALAQ
jgi:hypothetical protein